MIRSHDYRVYVVKCDHCGHQSRSVADGLGTAHQALFEAIANGWVQQWDRGQTEMIDLCPECVPLTEVCS